jgi:hypothetical protein
VSSKTRSPNRIPWALTLRQPIDRDLSWRGRQVHAFWALEVLCRRSQRSVSADKLNLDHVAIPLTPGLLVSQICRRQSEHSVPTVRPEL